MSYLETINAKKSDATIKAQSQSELDTLIAQLKEVQLASLMNNKTSVVLADSTDFGEKMQELGDKITTVIDEFRNDNKNADKIEAIALEQQKLATYTAKVNRESAADFKATIGNLVKAVQAIKIPEVKIPEVKIPEVKQPAPIVNVPVNDFSPITRAIESLKEEKGIDLDDFKAHDITDSGDNQYIGFVAPTGVWYIIENQTKNNRLRYVFGKKGYTKAFSQAPTYQYELLSEAINAL